MFHPAAILQKADGHRQPGHCSDPSVKHCAQRTVIHMLARDQKHNINQNISITLAKSQLKEFRGKAGEWL